MKEKIAVFIKSFDNFAAGKGFNKLSIIIIAIEIISIINGNTGKDLWEHRAVLRELINNPFNPDHPIVSLHIPHAFFSPYSVILAFVGYLTKLNAFTLLTIAGIINLFALIYVIRYFAFSLFDHNQQKISFFILLFLFIGWGPAAWRFSSFYHITTLHLVLPYPSTWAFILSLFSFALYIKMVKHNKWSVSIKLVPFLIILNTVVLLTHPTTAIFLLVFILGYALTTQLNKIDLKSILSTSLVFALPFAIAGYWPYYDFWDLFLNQSDGSQFHAASHTFYAKLFIRLLPLWFVLPLIWKRWMQDFKDVFVVVFIGFLTIYLYGLFTGQYGFGRVIFFMAFVLHIVLAEWFANIDINNIRNKLFSALFLALMLPFLLFHTPMIIRNIIPGLQDKPYKGLSFLRKEINDDDVVITDLKTTLYVPAYKGKVIASLYPPYWITDNDSRLNDIKSFFNNSTTDLERKNILLKRNVDYILLYNDLGKVDKEVKQFIYSVSQIKAVNQNYTLFKVTLK